MQPYQHDQGKRFTTKKAELLEHIGTHRLIAESLQRDNSLGNQWWSTPYKGDVDKPGQHLPNCVMALSTMIMMRDLLLMGCQTIDGLIPGEVSFAQYMPPKAQTQEKAAVMYFFMLSHFVADASMPCHCDGRKLAGYEEGIHKELEAHWSKRVGTYSERKNLLNIDPDMSPRQIRADSTGILQQAQSIDNEFKLNFGNNDVSDLIKGHDVWLEMVYQCRASFALSSVIVPYQSYSYDDQKVRASFDNFFGESNTELLEDVDRVVMHDAILNIAIIWKHIWNEVSTE